MMLTHLRRTGKEDQEPGVRGLGTSKAMKEGNREPGGGGWICRDKWGVDRK